MQIMFWTNFLKQFCEHFLLPTWKVKVPVEGVYRLSSLSHTSHSCPLLSSTIPLLHPLLLLDSEESWKPLEENLNNCKYNTNVFGYLFQFLDIIFAFFHIFRHLPCPNYPEFIWKSSLVTVSMILLSFTNSFNHLNPSFHHSRCIFSHFFAFSELSPAPIAPISLGNLLWLSWVWFRFIWSLHLTIWIHFSVILGQFFAFFPIFRTLSCPDYPDFVWKSSLVTVSVIPLHLTASICHLNSFFHHFRPIFRFFHTFRNLPCPDYPDLIRELSLITVSVIPFHLTASFDHLNSFFCHFRPIFRFFLYFQNTPLPWLPRFHSEIFSDYCECDFASFDCFISPSEYIFPSI
jgi:hypothetical protein